MGFRAAVLACVFSTTIFASCAEIIASAQPPSFQPPAAVHRVVHVEAPRIADALPEFNPETEMLFNFRGDGHASFVVGERRVDWGGDFSGHRSKLSIPWGVMLRVELGKELVARLRDAIDGKLWTGVEALTCLHNELVFLQRQGVRVAVPRFLGTSLYESLLHHGFIDSQGTRFPQTVYILYPHANLLTETLQNMIHAQRGFFAKFLESAQVTPLEAVTAIEMPPEYASIYVELLGGGAANIPAPVLWGAHELMLRFEKTLAHILITRWNVGWEKAFDVFSTERASLPPGILHDTVLEALRMAANGHPSTL